MAIQKNKLRKKACTLGNAPVAMVAGRKLTFSPELIKYLGFEVEDIGKDSKTNIGILVEFDEETNELILAKVPRTEGGILGGTKSSPETYCASICNAILTAINEKLENAGTVNFPDVKEEIFEEDGSPCVVVNVLKHRENQGVFVKHTSSNLMANTAKKEGK